MELTEERIKELEEEIRRSKEAFKIFVETILIYKEKIAQLVAK